MTTLAGIGDLLTVAAVGTLAARDDGDRWWWLVVGVAILLGAASTAWAVLLWSRRATYLRDVRQLAAGVAESRGAGGPLWQAAARERDRALQRGEFAIAAELDRALAAAAQPAPVVPPAGGHP